MRADLDAPVWYSIECLFSPARHERLVARRGQLDAADVQCGLQNLNLPIKWLH